jgi:hypothetical protein
MSENKKESLWKNRSKILEGIKNRIFKKDVVESIAAERNEICKKCEYYDSKGDHCYIPGTQPCCAECGCSLALKQRSLSSNCGEGYWESVLTDEEDLNHEALNPENYD